MPNIVTAVNVYGPIKTGDILWNIAAKVRPDPSISRYQVMIALFEANSHAFEVLCNLNTLNLNTLKIGQMLHIPSPIAMQALSRTEAFREFKRQQKEWKVHRRQKRTINCLQQPKLPTTISQPVTKTTIFSPIVVTPITDPSVIFSSKNKKLSTTVVQKKAIPPVTSSTWNDVLARFLTQMSLPPMIGFLMIIILLLLLLISRNLRKYATEQSIVTKKPFIQLETTPQFNEHHTTVNSKDSPSASDPTNASLTVTAGKEGLYAEMKEKLENVRGYMAGDEAHTIQKTLREVIQKGTPEQKDEAKQLYEINKKINLLKPLDKEKESYSAFSKTTIANSQVWQKAKHFQAQQQYSLENQEKVFGLVDKFFELLDYELNGQGKLFDAYVKRQQQKSSKNYEILDKSENPANDEAEVNLAKTIRSEPKPTRVL